MVLNEPMVGMSGRKTKISTSVLVHRAIWTWISSAPQISKVAREKSLKAVRVGWYPTPVWTLNKQTRYSTRQNLQQVALLELVRKSEQSFIPKSAKKNQQQWKQRV